jgi:hypothetical protein
MSWWPSALRWPWDAPLNYLWFAVFGSLFTLAIGWVLSQTPLNDRKDQIAT